MCPGAIRTLLHGYGKFALASISTVLLLLAVPTQVFAGADEAQQKQRELTRVQQRIEALTRQLDSARSRKSRGEQQLADIEKQIGRTHSRLRELDSQLNDSRRQLENLNDGYQSARQDFERQRRLLAAEARATYAMGRQQQVKLLLNQEDPAAAGRMFTYFRYFTRARSARMDALRESLARLQSLEKDIQSENDVLERTREAEREASDQLMVQKRLQRQALNDVQKELDSGADQLASLRDSEKQLQQLLASLQEVLADIPDDAVREQSFAAMKGQLDWPAGGRITASFGSRRQGGSGLKWRGVLIEAPGGGEVQSVAQGRVAFADWMRGFGLLMIIDHGDSYMSLYGHNQALYKEVGEWVDTGEVIATLGASGGQKKPGLYFELRHQGRPINPRKWCKGQPTGPVAQIVPLRRKLWYGLNQDGREYCDYPV